MNQLGSNENAPRWKHYLYPHFLVARVQEKGLIWCTRRGLRLIWQRMPSGLRSFVLHVMNVVVRIVAFPVSVLLYLVGIRVLVNCRTGGIGHLAIEPAWFVARNHLANSDHTKRHILLLDRGVANKCLLELLKSFLAIYGPEELALVLKYLARYHYITLDIGVAPPEGTPHDRSFTHERNSRHAQMMTDIQDYRYKHRKRIFNLPDELLEAGRRNLAILGLGDSDWFVCLHAGEVTKDGKWGYELFRRQRIDSFFEVVDYIAKKGGKVIRMGHRDLPEIADTVSIIDYPHSRVKCDWMDLFLVSECRYFIGCQSGLQMVAVIFGKPQILTNIIPWQMVTGFDGDIYLPKMIKSKRTSKLLSVKEYLDNDLHFAQWGLPESFTAIPNDSEDVINAVDEMESYLSNREKLPELDDLQALWRESFPARSQCQCSDVRISASFVEKYKDAIFKGIL